MAAMSSTKAELVTSQSTKSEVEVQQIMKSASSLSATSVNKSPATETLPAFKPNPCQDKASRCGEWATAGECTRNPRFMQKECAASCGTCGTSEEQQRQPAQREPSMMPQSPKDAEHDQAKQALGQELRCHAWAASGECVKNPAYMRDKCRDACARPPKMKEEA